ncbi:DNAAF5 [Lepeophtheirus salmonis]|uniref:DNAAF5 n=1 Tax=Lepeophtheirus salmonis TaxID=72036 RepID=A0A7R8CQ49_LEPSM|nr:DNAAF5 [Lepeophtheirus salmonis]CAF2891946.1 DNAAF5 [Lepeophtheirus salmonis]
MESNTSNFQLQRSLEADNKVVRKKGYKKLEELMLKEELNVETVSELFGDLLLKGVEDEAEGVRESSLQILLKISDIENEINWSSFFLIIRRKEEPSEEVRLLRLVLLINLFKRDSITKLYCEDILAILPTYLADPFHEIRIQACHFLIDISSSLNSSVLKLSLPQILPSLLYNFSHLRKKVREAAIQSLPHLIIASQNCEEEFGDTDVTLAQRCFDPAPKVRLALNQTCSSLLQNWSCNSSHQLRIILILLSQYNDEVEEVKNDARTQWEKVAQVWFKKEIKSSSNGQSLKDKIDFPEEVRHYPPEISRPSVPCREYLSQLFHKNTSLCMDGPQRLENRLTEHSVKILETLEHGAKDNETEVVENLMKASKYFGYFVNPKVWTPIIIQRLTSLDTDSKTTLLKILSNIIKGSNSELLSFVLVNLGDCISHNDISYSYKDQHLKCLLNCIEDLMNVCHGFIKVIQYQIFKCLLVAISLSQNFEIKEEGRSLREKLLSSTSSEHDSNGSIKSYSLRLVNEIICPALKWSSGRKAEAVRIASAATLLSVFETKAFTPQDIESLFSTDLFLRMNSLLEDNSVKTRLFIVKSYTKVFEMGKNVFQAHQIMTILSFLTQRLNDKSNEVRIESVKAIRAADECLDPEVTTSTYIKEIEKLYEKIIIHMDDELSEIRLSVCDLLQDLSIRDPLIMKKVLTKTASQHRHTEECSLLMKHIENMALSS